MEPEDDVGSFLQSLDHKWDLRKVDELAEIQLSENFFEGFDLDDFVSMELIIPDTSDNAAFLCEQLTCLIFTLDALYSAIANKHCEPDKQKLTQLNIIRGLLMNQFCVADLSLESVYKYTYDRKDFEQRLDILVFYCLLECVACMTLFPSYRKVFGEMKPATTLKFLCEKTVISRDLRDAVIWNLNGQQLLQAFKYLEVQWNFVEYNSEILLYLDLLLCRVAILYKVPQSNLIYAGVTPWCRSTRDGALCSDVMLQDLCWTFRPMYQKIRTRLKISQNSSLGQVNDDIANQLSELARQNARDMNNTNLTEKFRTIYLRYAVRPSEIQRFCRDKPGKYASPIHVMKHGRSKEAIDRMLEQLAVAPWALTDPLKSPLDKTSTDIMRMLLISAMVSNMWGFQWSKRFVVMNLDLVTVEDVSTRIDYENPMILQDFNRFNLFYDGRLYLHNSIAKSFAHWYTIMCLPPYNGRFEGRNLKTQQLTFLLQNPHYSSKS